MLQGEKIMSVARVRKEASARLGLEMKKRYRACVEAQADRDEDAMVKATVDLSQLFSDNIEFVIWALLMQGGLNPPSPELTTKLPRKPDVFQ
jgi:hypothetical protein